MAFLTLNDVDLTRKTALLRVDFNSPIDPLSSTILDDKRFREHVPTIQAMEDAKCVILTHQSRPGKKDFTTLEAHAEILARLLARPVDYVDDIFGKCARDAVRNMEPGDVLMLENVRFNAEENLKLPPEDAKKTLFVRKIVQMADIFVNDAFGTAHRSQPSIVGIPLVIRSVAGLLMQREVETLSRVMTGAPKPVVFVLGGTKVDDSVDVARNVLENGIADRVVVVGVVANIFLIAAGYDIGAPSAQLVEKLGYTGEIAKARDLLDRYRDAILLPSHVAVRAGNGRAEHPVDAIPPDKPVMDLGMDAIFSTVAALRAAGTVVFNGPAGVFEDAHFSIGTLELLRAASEAVFSVVGGGHTAAVIEKIGLEDRFTHISTGGGACIEFLTGKPLPAVSALEASKRLFW
ncbi:MAG: phosphoglycerate kinase [Methanomicrobiaceae archaeon]|nr:phosphoglycerate kinase [Methanomicrobiaceae archaeon]